MEKGMNKPRERGTSAGLGGLKLEAHLKIEMWRSVKTYCFPGRGKQSKFGEFTNLDLPVSNLIRC